MPAPQDVEQWQAIANKAQALVDQYQLTLQLRTKERDALAEKLAAIPEAGDNVVQLTPIVLLRERREGANSIIKVAMRRIRAAIGTNARVHQVLSDLLDEK